jgi:hypothetical protein
MNCAPYVFFTENCAPYVVVTCQSI